MWVSLWWVLTAADWQSDSGLSDRSPSGPSWASTNSTHKLRCLQVWPKKKISSEQTCFEPSSAMRSTHTCRRKKKSKLMLHKGPAKEKVAASFPPEPEQTWRWQTCEALRWYLSICCHHSAGDEGARPTEAANQCGACSAVCPGWGGVGGGGWLLLLLSSVLIGQWQM